MKDAPSVWIAGAGLALLALVLIGTIIAAHYSPSNPPNTATPSATVVPAVVTLTATPSSTPIPVISPVAPVQTASPAATPRSTTTPVAPPNTGSSGLKGAR